jgi:2-amino-4-hydroxy-6-hydroxymethyldihydropteridine diphosphokinase
VKDAVRAVIALGSNVGEPERQVRAAFDEIAALPYTRLLDKSRLRWTEPVGYQDQPAFVNACALIETALKPRALLDRLLDIEQRHGRVREIRNGPRTLDLDIVVYGDKVVAEPGLTIPHPRAHERRFVLEPLVEVWPEAVIAGKGEAKELLARL